MAVSNIRAIVHADIRTVWDTVLNIEGYSWRSDLGKTERVSETQFIEYTKDGFPTSFTVTYTEPYRRWEFDMENSSMKGHWTGVFTPVGAETQIDFTENVSPKNRFMTPFVKLYLKKQQARFVTDLEKALSKGASL